MKTMKLTLSTLFTGAILLAGTGVRADEGHDHTGDVPHAAEKTGKSSHAGMTAIYAHLQAIKGQLDSSKLNLIHEHAMAIDSAAKDLDQDPSLDAAKKKRVQGYVKNIAKIADVMHDAADEKKLDETKKAFGKLKAQVDLLDKQFSHSHNPALMGHKEAAKSDSAK